jgi:formylglycine-generating enzyme required for sulfatase activity
VHRRSAAAAIGLVAAVVAGITVALAERWRATAERRAEAARRDADLGLITLELTAFDWDAASLRAVPVPLAELPALSWRLHAPSFEDPHEPGVELPPERLRRSRGRRSVDGTQWIEPVEAPGGAVFLVVTGRGRAGDTCERAVVPLQSLPGYARRGGGRQILRIQIPTCRATDADMIEVPAGPFVFGGVGEPPSAYQAEFPERVVERVVELPAYRIDRTEVPNAAFAVFAAMRDAIGISPPAYISNSDLRRVADPRSPASGVTWREAVAYCRYLGKRLPTSAEWEKAMRGGLALPGGPNPAPRRNFPWGTSRRPQQANLRDELARGPQPVGSYAEDRSPYGVVDLAGNVSEWISSAPTGTADTAEFFRSIWRLVRGGNWSETPADDLVNYTPIENYRPGDTRSFSLGMRCAR